LRAIAVWASPRFLTFKQAIEVGGNVRKGGHGTKVYFVKHLRVTEREGEEQQDARLIPMLREYTVFTSINAKTFPTA
jgi:antirestriction protein ArdC